LEISIGKTKVFGFVGTDHLRAKIITDDETLDQVNQFTYSGCSISYQFSNDVELKLAKFLQLIGTINRTIIKESQNGNHFEIIQHFSFTYIFIWGSENWTLTASQRRRIEAEEMKLLRPLAGYNLL